MNTNLDKLENSMVKLTIEVDAAKFEEGMQRAYNQNKNKITIQGFRKGKAPRALIEKTYGPEIFYEEAANFVIPEAYDSAVEEHKLEVVSRPIIDVEQMEKGKNFIFTAKVAVKPEVEIDNYKGIEVVKKDTEVKAEDIDEEIDKIKEQNSRLIDVDDRPVQDGDEITLDFEGFIDGVPFEGGKAENHNLIIGSHSFIDNFEEQLIGKSIEEEAEINVTFPDDYHQEELKGKPTMFKVKIKSIKVKEYPEIDDEFAQDVSEFESLDEYKASLKETIKERKEEEAKKDKQDQVLKKILNSTTIELPEPMVELEAENMIKEFAHNMQYQGFSIDQYLTYMGQSMTSLKNAMKTEAANKIKIRLILEKIAAKENLEVTEEEYNTELQKMADMYGMKVEQLTKNIGKEEEESIKQDMLNQMALKLITDTTVEK